MRSIDLLAKLSLHFATVRLSTSKTPYDLCSNNVVVNDDRKRSVLVHEMQCSNFSNSVYDVQKLNSTSLEGIFWHEKD